MKKIELEDDEATALEQHLLDWVYDPDSDEHDPEEHRLLFEVLSKVENANQ